MASAATRLLLSAAALAALLLGQEQLGISLAAAAVEENVPAGAGEPGMDALHNEEPSDYDEAHSADGERPVPTSEQQETLAEEASHGSGQEASDESSPSEKPVDAFPEDDEVAHEEAPEQEQQHQQEQQHAEEQEEASMYAQQHPSEGDEQRPSETSEQQASPPATQPQDNREEAPKEQQQQQTHAESPPAGFVLPLQNDEEHDAAGESTENTQQEQQKQQQQPPATQETSVEDPRVGRCSAEELSALTLHFADASACPAFGCIDSESSNYLALIEKHYGDKFTAAEAAAFAGVLAACHCRCPVMRCEIEYVNQHGSEDCKQATREFCLQSNTKFSDKCSFVAKQLPKVYDIEADPHAFKSPCQVCEPEMPNANSDPREGEAEVQGSGTASPLAAPLSALVLASVAAAMLL